MADWTAHVTVTALMKNACRILLDRVAGERPIGRQEEMNRSHYDRHGKFIDFREVDGTGSGSY